MTIRIEQRDPHESICVALIIELSAELGTLYGGDGTAAFVASDVTVPRAAFVVAWLDGFPVGCGALRPTKEKEDTAEVKRMYVRPVARGKGLSLRILGKLESLASDFGYKTVILETGIRQPQAIGLYETSGYVRMGCYGQYEDDPLSLCFQKSLG
jgi:GNAT superfamily N-acetyltransferase